MTDLGSVGAKCLLSLSPPPGSPSVWEEGEGTSFKRQVKKEAGQKEVFKTGSGETWGEGYASLLGLL